MPLENKGDDPVDVQAVYEALEQAEQLIAAAKKQLNRIVCSDQTGEPLIRDDGEGLLTKDLED